MTQKCIARSSKRSALSKCAVTALSVGIAVLGSAATASATTTGGSGTAGSTAGPGATVPTPNVVANPLGTAKATAGEVDLDLQLLGGLLGSLHLTNSTGLDVPLANLVLGQAAAPTADGDAANFTNSTLRLRDNLIAQLHLPGPEANLLDADVASGTARVTKGPGGFAQAYATVANLRLFLPLVNLPGADANNGVLKIDLVSAQATCAAGQAPSASAKMPTTVQLLGHDIPVPLTGDIPLDLGPLGKIDVHLAPTTVEDKSGASAAVEARVSVDAIGLAKVSGAVVLASASCTSPVETAGGGTSGSGGPSSPASPSTSVGAGAGNQSGTPTSGPAAMSDTQTTAGAGTVGGMANASNATPLAETGGNPIVWPMAGAAAVAILLGAYLVRFRKRIKDEDVD